MRRFIFRIVIFFIALLVMLPIAKHYNNRDDVSQGDMSGPSIVRADEFNLEDAQIVAQSFMDISMDFLQELYSGTEFKDKKTYQYYVHFSHENPKEELSVQQQIIQYATQQNQEYIPDEYYVELTMKIFESNGPAKEEHLKHIYPYGKFEKYSELLKACGSSCVGTEVTIENEEELYRYLTLGDAEKWGCDEIVVLYGGLIYLIKDTRVMEVSSNIVELSDESSAQVIDAIKRVLNYDFSEEIETLNQNKTSNQ